MHADRGEPVHGELVSADASGVGAVVLLYNASLTAARTLGATEYLNITQVRFTRDDAGTFGLFAITDAAGKRICQNLSALLPAQTFRFDPPYTCPKGVTPYVIAESGNVRCFLDGYITQA